MNLQLRLRHALGTRMVDLAPRGADKPLVVGRDASADVQVPSTTVAPLHCQLFQHEGEWIVQDCNSPSGTYVNGNRINEPTVINFGDVITLGAGAKAPALEVDPLGVGRASAKPARAAAAVSSSRVPQQSPVSQPPQPMGASARVPGWQTPPQANVQQPDDEWGAASAAMAAKPGGYRRPAKKQSGSLVGITVACSAVIVLIGGILFYQLSQREKNKESQKVVVASRALRGDGTIFSQETQQSTKHTKPTTKDAVDAALAARLAREAREAAAANATDTPDDTTADPGEAPTTRPKTGLDSVSELSNMQGQPPAMAINTAERYLYNNKKTPLKAEIEKAEAGHFTRLWWDHIADLCKARHRHADGTTDLKQKVAEATDADFKKEQKKLLEREMDLWDKYNKELNDIFGYKREEPPTFDETQASMSAEMKTKFAEWKTAIRLQIVRKNGEVYGPLE